MQNEPLITLGDLLKIKREVLGLTLKEVESHIKVTGLTKYEKDLIKPRKKALNRLVEFYKISDEELNNLKPTKNRKQKSSHRIESILQELDRALQAVHEMSEQGVLAKNIKKDALSNLKKARECISDSVVLDNLI